MRWADIPFHPRDKTLRQFALLWIGFFLLLALWQRSGALVVVALTIGPVGLLWPRVIRPIYVGWLMAVFPIGWVVSRLILALLFFGLFTPVALVFRLIGRDPLQRRSQPQATTYWKNKFTPTEVRSYFHQS